MKAISLRQQRRLDYSYLAGVVKGDGYCTNRGLGLVVKDLDFAQTFASCVNRAFGVNVSAHADRGYWRVIAFTRTGRFDVLRGWSCTTRRERASWVRGLFDSEGNAQLTEKKDVSENSYGRRVAMYSTTLATLETARSFLNELGIPTWINPVKSGKGHLGTKRVYELRVAGSKRNYQNFSELVGSSIERKRKVLSAIAESYRPDHEYLRLGQAKGAAVKSKRTREMTIPKVLGELKRLSGTGQKLTERYCIGQVRGYGTIYNYFGTHSLILRAAGVD